MKHLKDTLPSESKISFSYVFRLCERSAAVFNFISRYIFFEIASFLAMTLELTKRYCAKAGGI